MNQHIGFSICQLVLSIKLTNTLFSFSDIISSITPWYIFATISAAVVVVVIAMIGVICFLRHRRKNPQRDKEQASPQVEMKHLLTTRLNLNDVKWDVNYL